MTKVNCFFLKFVKDRARLVNNDFGEDPVLSYSREKKRVSKRGGWSIFNPEMFPRVGLKQTK